MKKQQILLSASGLIFLLALLLFGKTTTPAIEAKSALSSNINDSLQVHTQDLINKARNNLSENQLKHITHIENDIKNGKSSQLQQIAAFKELSQYYKDSLQQPLISNSYLAEAAKLENSEKSLTFAARLFLEELMLSGDAPMQTWLASQAKELFDKALVLNPGNDSSKVGIAVCYIFGNISASPMQGIQALKEISEKNPENMYAQMMLGVASIRSGQYDKGVERFLYIVKKQPANVEAVFNLAEAYDQKNDKTNAIKWYKVAQQLIDIPEAKSEIEKRIKLLQ